VFQRTYFVISFKNSGQSLCETFTANFLSIEVKRSTFFNVTAACAFDRLLTLLRRRSSRYRNIEKFGVWSYKLLEITRF